MTSGLGEFLERNSLSGAVAYIVTTYAILAATGLRLLAIPVLGTNVSPVFHGIALIFVASLAGLGPSLYGLLLAIASVWVLDIHDMPLREEIFNRTAMFAAGVVMCVVTSTMRSALIDAARAKRESDFLTFEMHHRVKNLFAVIASMVTLSARDHPEAQRVLDDLRMRIQALSSAHDVAINPTDFVSLHDLTERLMAPHMKNRSARERVKISGSDLGLPVGYTTPLGLILNELSTNAVKYGALARRSGRVHLSWHHKDDRLELRWQEIGMVPDASEQELGRPGFGSLLVEASVKQLRGWIDRNLTDDGLVVRLSIPMTQKQTRFPSGGAAATQDACNPPPFSLSALRVSKRFFLRKPRIRDSRS